MDQTDTTAIQQFSVQLFSPLRFLGVMLAVFVVLLTPLFPLIYFKVGHFGLIMVLYFSAIVLLVVIYGKRLVTTNSLLNLSDKQLTVESRTTTVIDLEDISHYQADGPWNLTITLKRGDQKKIRLWTNSNFSDTTDFEKFVTAFEIKMDELITAGKIQAVREPAFLENWYALPLLVTITLGAIGGIAWNISRGYNILFMLLICTIGLSKIWYAYFTVRNRMPDKN